MGQCDGIAGTVDLDSLGGDLGELLTLGSVSACAPRLTGIESGQLRPPSNGTFIFEITAYGQNQVFVQVSENLASWDDLANLPLSGGKAVCLDPEAGTHQARFYRLK